MKNIFQQRLGHNINLQQTSKIICHDFKLGNFIKAKIIPIGYEDVNFSLETDRGKFFIKIFSNLRSLNDCKRNVDILVKLLKNKISVPKLYESDQGYLHLIKSNRIILRMCVIDFIDGKDLFTTKHHISNKNISYIAKQVALIDSLKIKPKKIYDSWAIVNFQKEFKKKSKYLNRADLKLIQPLLIKFKKLNLKKYQKIITLKTTELELLPLYINFARAMLLLRANYEKKINKNTTKENEHFLNIGRVGLQQIKN